MAFKIESFNPSQTTDAAAALGADKKPKSGFAEVVSKSIQSVNNDLVQASKVSESFLTGEKTYDIHEVMISLEKADVSFRYMAQIRNKVLDAYNEIMRMQV